MSNTRRRLAPVLGACVVFSCAGASSAAPHWEYVTGGDAEFDVLTAYGSFVFGAAETRVGNGDTTGTWEQAIWWRVPGVFPPAATGQLDIINGAGVDFDVSWRESDTTLTFTVGAQSISWDGISGGFTDVFVRVFAASGPNSFVRLTDLDLVGSGLQPPDMNVANGVAIIRINQYGAGPMTPIGDFTLTGTHNFSWGEQFPSEWGLAYQIYLTSVIPAPGGAALFGIVGALTARRRAMVTRGRLGLGFGRTRLGAHHPRA